MPTHLCLGQEASETSGMIIDAPIAMLPPELLAEIFEHCTVIESFVPVRLSHVSRLWRYTAISTPRLWRRINVELPSSTPEVTASKVCSWLQRSGVFPIEVFLLVHEWVTDHWQAKIVNPLRDHSHHWGRFALEASSHEVARKACVFFTASHRHDILSRMDIRTAFSMGDAEELHGLINIGGGDDNPCRDITALFQGLMETRAPRFRELNITTSALPLPCWSTARQPELSHLRVLRIYECYIGTTEIRAASILNLLAKCPSLEYFVFRGECFSPPPHNHITNVHLPFLRQLHLIRTFHQRTLLSHLCTPSLETLRLIWLNYGKMPSDEFYDSDPMEMDEELTEFSQSPQTDLLTGLGLRALIRNSAPHIRVFDMDFSDMRSPKDFVWVFKHLPLLESFRIIGSDMSDRVLFALASPGRDGRWLCPLLTELEFSRCDVITGKGVVALAKGRNERSTLHGPQRLNRFTVDFCANVDCESVAVMQYLLGIVNFEIRPVAIPP